MGLITADQNIPTQQSSAEELIAWYQLLPGSKVTANNVWLQVWQAHNGAKSAANTSELRSWMSANAGISLTTDGVGSVIDSAKSFVNTIEDAAMLPIYGLIALLGIGTIAVGFMIYEGVKNPEEAGKVIEMVGKTAAIAA